MKIIYFLSILWFTTLSHAINGNNSIDVQSKYAIDKTSSWKKEDLIHKSFVPFLTNTNLNIGYNKNATIWCLFTFKNKTPNYHNTSWLVINNNHIDSLVFYDQNKIQILGDRTKYPSRFLEGQCFKINLKPNEQKQLIVKLKKGISFFDFSYYHEKENVLAFNSMLKITFISFFFGAILLLVLFNSILYYITKNRVYLLYILYSILTTLYISISTSYLKNYIFTDFLFFSELRVYISCFWFVSLSLFITYFLDVKINHPQFGLYAIFTPSKTQMNKNIADFKSTYYNPTFNTYNPYNKSKVRLMWYQSQVVSQEPQNENLKIIYSNKNASWDKFNLQKSFK